MGFQVSVISRSLRKRNVESQKHEFMGTFAQFDNVTIKMKGNKMMSLKVVWI